MQFRIESFLNSYLPTGTRRVDAILTVTADNGSGGGGAPVAAQARAVVGLIIDISGSMQGDRINSVKYATRKVIELLDPNAFFFVTAFSDRAVSVFPLAQATPQNKQIADAQVRRVEAGGGTRMSTGLMMALSEFQKMPGALHYALFLTDGKNNEEDDLQVNYALTQAEPVFQCDCRGVGTDWQPKQLQKISQKLLGTAMIIPDPSGVEADFRAAIQNAMGRAVGGVRLRLWTPKSAKILVCKQMSPEILVLTDRATQVDAQTQDFPTGAWGSESRDYYIALELAAGDIGDEMLGCRPSIVYQEAGQEVKATAPPIVVTWTDDEALSARINTQVAHYTGQAELAQAIQQGLEARAQGDVDAATHLFGRAAKLAHDSGNEDTTRRLAKVVDIVDAGEGTVRLKSAVAKADEMDLDLGSTRTSRAARRPQEGA
jgi:uncharacterized protein YegL